MRSRSLRRLALAGAALFGLAGCHFDRNVADDCWTNREALGSANRFRLGLTARNLPPDDGAWASADARIARARTELRACEDGAPGTGRPRVADLRDSHAPAGGAHGGESGGHGT